MSAMRILLLLCVLIGLGGCGPGDDSGPVNVGIIGDPQSLFDEGIRLSAGAQHIVAATQEGVVSLDPSGQIIPALAERWIVTEDGLSYIFRLRDVAWPNEREMTAEDVRRILRERLRQLEGTSLGLDLAKITDIRAMTGRVIEIRLSSPMPEFLRLLAQPELGITLDSSGLGPMRLTRDDQSPRAQLDTLPPEQRGFAAREDWPELTRQLNIRAMPAVEAVEAFSGGELDIIMDGRLGTFPLSQLGPLSRGNIQVDPALGLLGLSVRNAEGVLADPAIREALSMAIDRAGLIAPFGLGGWQPTSWIVPPSLFEGQDFAESRWPALSLEQRQELAGARIADWEAANDNEAVVRVALPTGPGGDLLFEQLSDFWQAIGVTTVRVELGEGAELEWRDRLARYSSPRWFLNQFNCGLEIGLCSEEVDALVQSSLSLSDIAEKQQRLAEAHALLVSEEVFIPLGAPVRWSLVRGAVEGYQANQWGMHPLFPLSEAPT